MVPQSKVCRVSNPTKSAGGSITGAPPVPAANKHSFRLSRLAPQRAGRRASGLLCLLGDIHLGVLKCLSTHRHWLRGACIGKGGAGGRQTSGKTACAR